jgi:hypothetical protein
MKEHSKKLILTNMTILAMLLNKILNKDKNNLRQCKIKGVFLIKGICLGLNQASLSLLNHYYRKQKT